MDNINNQQIQSQYATCTPHMYHHLLYPETSSNVHSTLAPSGTVALELTFRNISQMRSAISCLTRTGLKT